MGRIFSTIALLGIFTTASGFSTPKLTTTRQNFPAQPRTITATCPNDKVQSIVTTRMANDDGLSEGEKTEKATDSTSEEAAPAMSGTNGDAASIVSGVNGDAAPMMSGANGDAMAIVSTKDTDTTTTDESDDSKKSAYSLILLPTMLFKFAIVMLVKFATDIVVFPLLFSYRMARLGKRKFMRGLKKLFGQKDEGEGSLEVKVNGDSTSPAESS
eukprot:CAMPEP_0172310810 /NCGR_PEP_ID=MMETSP1058-20130122/12704_1 /TAXON_ID=83371 /ORGANISM="Detonula confervacea, Strain CCMP 353" /LENGTH=213 /DNA_ID=CAMNT_0013023753 /DNA_START=98 /DNA_END=739 /DNA_ORIENTATION=-